MGLRTVSQWPLAIVLLFSINAFADNGAEYRARYALTDAKQKLVDNHGDGYEALYGTRNFRSVLNGVYYRGGANNRYHRSHRRSNTNPLPNDGLKNLCEEGFTTAVYLYPTNYASAPLTTSCVKADGTPNTLTYVMLKVLSASNSQLHDLLALMQAHVQDEGRGPIYAHCWNGWHASGVTAAYTLRQFCGFTGDQAVAYWNANTDGHNDSSYESLRRRIRSFVPFPDLALTEEQKARVCPSGSSLKF